jgi:hypothetical protein
LPDFAVAYCGNSPRIAKHKELTLNFKTHFTLEILDCDSLVTLGCGDTKGKNQLRIVEAATNGAPVQLATSKGVPSAS